MLKLVKLGAGLVTMPPLVVLVSVLCAVGVVGCGGMPKFGQDEGPSPFELAATNIGHAADKLAEAAQTTADAVAIIQPTTADDVNAAADALAQNAQLVAQASMQIAESVANAEATQEAQTEAIIQAIGTTAGVAGTIATGSPAAGAAMSQATVSLGELAIALAGVFGLTAAGAARMRSREIKAWYKGKAEAVERAP